MSSNELVTLVSNDKSALVAKAKLPDGIGVSSLPAGGQKDEAAMFEWLRSRRFNVHTSTAGRDRDAAWKVPHHFSHVPRDDHSACLIDGGLHAITLPRNLHAGFWVRSRELLSPDRLNEAGR